jgi:hypothetical protein
MSIEIFIVNNVGLIVNVKFRIFLKNNINLNVRMFSLIILRSLIFT